MGRQKHPKTSSFLSQVPGHWLRGTERRGCLLRVPEATGSACLKEKLFCGAHCWLMTTSPLYRVGNGVGEVGRA